jgi:Methylase involved in ubiquinone/menaquinone biosynthesis
MQSTPADVVGQPSPSVHDRLAEIVRPGAGEVVVDLGCGSGRSLAALAARGGAACLVGLDLAASRLGEAAARVAEARLVRADLTRPLPLATASVDAVLCHNVIELLPEPTILLGEVGRVVRPGGRVVLSHTDFAGLVVHGAEPGLTDRILHAYAHVPQPWMSHIDAFAARRLPELAARAGLVVERIEGHVLALRDLDGCRRLAEVAEVVRGHVRRGTVDVTADDVDAWWGQLADADRRGAFLFAETALITACTVTGPN